MSSIRSRKFEQANDNDISEIKGTLRKKRLSQQSSLRAEFYLTFKEHTLEKNTMLFKQKYKGQKDLWGTFSRVKTFSG